MIKQNKRHGIKNTLYKVVASGDTACGYITIAPDTTALQDTIRPGDTTNYDHLNRLLNKAVISTSGEVELTVPNPSSPSEIQKWVKVNVAVGYRTKAQILIKLHTEGKASFQKSLINFVLVLLKNTGIPTERRSQFVIQMLQPAPVLSYFQGNGSVDDWFRTAITDKKNSSC